MRHRTLVQSLLPLLLLAPACAVRAVRPAWVRASDANARLSLGVMARFSPEYASMLGVDGVDEAITDLRPGFVERQREATREVLGLLRGRLTAEPDALVRQDLEILIRSAEQSIEESRLQEKHLLTYPNPALILFRSMRALLDGQIPAGRRAAAAVRMRRYAGLEPGYRPLTELATTYVRDRLTVAGLQMPSRAELERDLADWKTLYSGVGRLAARFAIAGFDEPYKLLRPQLEAYYAFLRTEVLPRASGDFRLPPALYASRLRRIGVDLAPDELAVRARAAFAEIQREMAPIAARVAREQGLPSTDYREVIRALKARQLVGSAILDHYRGRLRAIEDILRRERLVTVPSRAARIRLASAAESAATPAPHMLPPKLIGNRGERGTFVLPLQIQGSGGRALRFDDFTFEAASWTLTAHEARPGHEMQFAAMVERGISLARAIFAFNSTNVEGWALYAERLVFPYLPAEGQLIGLQHRLLRAARAFLDPELQLGKVTPEDAERILRNDVVLSEAMARQELERYTFRSPGQATSYFHGYTCLLEIRREAEARLGTRFEPRRFHDFVLAQGLLPPALLRKAVLEWVSAPPSPSGAATPRR